MAALVYISRVGEELPAQELPADALLGHRNPALGEGEKHLLVTFMDGKTAVRLNVPDGRWRESRPVVREERPKR